VREEFSIRLKSGFSLIEAVVASTLLVIVISASVSGFAYMTRNDRLVNARIELDLDARQLIERMRYDLWHTSQGEILLYPPGTSGYTAISFPVINGSRSDYASGTGSLLWDTTVIYHFWMGDVFEVRRTVTPFISDKDQRQDELASVSSSGEGSSADSETQVLISNLVEWELDVTAAKIDMYAVSNSFATIALGSASLESGSHQITFTAVGKNKASIGSARHLGIDYLNITPSQLPLEGEWMTVASSSGATPTYQNMATNESWSGNARFWFPATANNHSFTLNFLNDSWEERNFLTSGDKKEALERYAMTKSGINTHGLRLEGNGDVWSTTNQTRNSAPSTIALTSNTSIRVILRGDQAVDHDRDNDADGGWLGFNGTNIWLVFSASGATTVSGVGITQQNPNGTNQYDTTGSTYSFTFDGGASSKTFSSGSVTSNPVGFFIERTNSYVVAFTISSGSTASAWSQLSGEESAYINRGGLWVSNEVMSLSRVRTGHASVGLYTSGVADTGVKGQLYSSIDWSQVMPSISGGSIQMHVRAADDYAFAGKPWILATKGGTPAVQGRYIQFRATLRPAANSSTRVTASPELHDVTIKWTGPKEFVDLEGKFAVGPSMGIYSVAVDGSPLLQGVQVKLTVKKDLKMGFGSAREVTATAYSEIVPRN